MVTNDRIQIWYYNLNIGYNHRQTNVPEFFLNIETLAPNGLRVILIEKISKAYGIVD